MLLNRSEIAAKWVEVTNGSVKLMDPAAYQDFADAHRRIFRTKLWDQESAAAAPNRRKQKQRFRSQQLKLVTVE